MQQHDHKDENPAFIAAVEALIRQGAKGTSYEAAIRRSHLDIARFEGWLAYILRFTNLKGARHLDVGCGSGGFVFLCAKRGARFSLGLEVDRGLWQLARIRVSAVAHASVVLYEGGDFPLASQAFDLVTSIHVIEHVRDLNRHIAELCRVTRPGGLILVECPNRLFPFEPHNHVPLITFLPKLLADFVCRLLSSLALFPQDLRLRLRNVTGIGHFISLWRLRALLRRQCRLQTLLESPVERFISEMGPVAKALRADKLVASAPAALARLLASIFSRNALIIARKL